MSAFKTVIRERLLPLISILVALALIIPVSYGNSKENIGQTPDAILKVSFIDVWQGDAILIETPDKKNIIIDGGPASHKDNIISYIDNKGIKVLHHVFATHLHPDHVGGLKYLLDKYKIGKLYDPGISYSHKDVQEYEKAREKLGPKYLLVKKRFNLEVSPGVVLKILNPDSTTDRDIHTACIVILLEYGSFSFLFTGDMNYPAEEKLIGEKIKIEANVLKVSHHGENDATSDKFLDAVNPGYAVISVGEGNKYRRPKKAVLKRLEGKKIEIFRTDVNGNILFEVKKDGTLNLIIEKQKITPVSGKSE